MNKKQKIAQLFSPAAFIHDTEENYQAIETLIREQEVGGLTFFHSRHSAAANFQKRAEVLDVSGTFEKLIGLINRYQRISKIPLLISIDGEYGLAMRIENTPQYPFAITLGALKNDAEQWVTEVAYRMGYIGKEELIRQADLLQKSGYGEKKGTVVFLKSFDTNIFIFLMI